MSEPFVASWRCSNAMIMRRHRGAAVILAMLTLALMAEIAALVVTDYGASMELLVGRQDQGQSRWLARAAVDWARNVLSEDARTGSTDHLGEIWATRIPPTPVEDGEVSGEIADFSGRFNLNGLVANGRADPQQVVAYRRLLALLGVPQADATALTAALVDWLDANDEPEAQGAESNWYGESGKAYRAANARLVDIDELRLIRGYGDDLVERLRAVTAALPETTPTNVNTASPEVLCALIQNLSIDDARAIATRRLSSPFGTVAAFLDQLPRMAIPPAASQLSVSSRYFLVGGRAKYGQAVARMQVLLDRKSNWSAIVWQKVL